MRNLIYHIYPLSANQVWVWNLNLIINQFHQFDRIIIGIAEDDRSVSAEVVSKHFENYKNVELVITNNRIKKGELTTLPTMLRMVESSSENDYTFYAHAKGVSRQGFMLKAVQYWVEAMYQYNFSLEVAKLFASYDCVGAFKRGGIETPGPIGNKFQWHYSGNFWWVRHSAVFTKDWMRCLTGRRHAAENFLGELIPDALAGCVGPSGVFPLYNLAAWQLPNGQIANAMASYKPKV